MTPLNPAIGMDDYLARPIPARVPKMRAAVGTGWNLGAWSAALMGRYVGKYRD